MSLWSSLPPSLLAFAAFASFPLRAQVPSPQVDTLRQRVILPPRIRVEQPTVIALADWGVQSDDSAFIPFRAVAAKRGFDFAVAAGRRTTILDVPGYAVHHVPADVREGFVLLVPRRRPKLLRGHIEPAQLNEALRAYLVEVRALAFRR